MIIQDLVNMYSNVGTGFCDTQHSRVEYVYYNFITKIAK